MNAEVNLSRVVPAGETGLFIPGSQNTKAGSCEGQSLFQLLLFQSLEQMSAKGMANSEETVRDSAEFSGSDGAAQEEPAEELVDLSGILMKLSTEVPNRAQARVPDKATPEVPVKASVEMPAKAVDESLIKGMSGVPMMSVKEMPPKAQQEEVPKMTFAELQGKAPVEMPAKATPEKPMETSTVIPAKDGVEAGNTTMSQRKKSLETTERELPVQVTTGSHDAKIQAALTKAAEKVEPYNQIGREIQLKLEQKGPMEFKMQLEPKDLGQIQIKLKVNEGKLMIDIMAASSKTHALLAGQVDKLIANMGLQNAEVETVQVELHNGERHSSFQQQPEGREREQYFSGTRYKGTETEHNENIPVERIPKSNFTRMDYTI